MNTIAQPFCTSASGRLFGSARVSGWYSPWRAETGRDATVFFGKQDRLPHVTVDQTFTQAFIDILTQSNFSLSPQALAQGFIWAATLLDNGASQAESIQALQAAMRKTVGTKPSSFLETAQLVDAIRLRGQRLANPYSSPTPSITKDPLPDWSPYRTQLTRLKGQGVPAPLLREIERTLSELEKLATEKKLSMIAPQSPSLDAQRKWSMRLAEGLELAVNLHKAQSRWDTHGPYVCHLLDVAGETARQGGSEDAIIAALLHDAVEDQGGGPTAKLIRKKFGAYVSELVKDCTQIVHPDWYTGKKAYINNIPKIRHPEALKIIAADKRHNLQTLNRSVREQGDAAWTIFRKGKHHQIWFYQSVLEKLEKKTGFSPTVLEAKRQLQMLKSWCFEQEAAAHMKDLTTRHPSYAQLDDIATKLPQTHTMTVTSQGKEMTFPPERQKLQQEIMQRELDSFHRHIKSSGRQKIAHMVTGLYASGKTTRLMNRLAMRDNAYIADADRIREQLPEFHVNPDLPQFKPFRLSRQNGLGATRIHKESSMMNDKLLDHVISEGGNFVIGHTGRDPDWDLRFIQSIRKLGYKVYLHHVELPPAIAMDRAIDRFYKEGRYVPLRYIAQLGSQPTRNFLDLKEKMLREGLIDGYTWSYNGVPKDDDIIQVDAYNAKLPP